MMNVSLRFFCDDARHLVCVPYSVENLHLMAQQLSIKRCWFHSVPGRAHYDIPKRQVARVKERCTVVNARDILAITKGTVS